MNAILLSVDVKAILREELHGLWWLSKSSLKMLHHPKNKHHTPDYHPGPVRSLRLKCSFELLKSHASQVFFPRDISQRRLDIAQPVCQRQAW